MYLSHLLIDVGDDPDRPRPGRKWLRNIYHVHQRLSMAFPTPEKRRVDADFLKPFCPGAFQKARFLFRVERGSADAATRSVLVLSDMIPDWGYAFSNAGRNVLLAGPCQCREYDPGIEPQRRLRFRILVNPSQKSGTHRRATDKVDRRGQAKSQGKRLAIRWTEKQRPDEVIVPWFERKVSAAFSVETCELVTLGWVAGYRPKDERTMRFRSALLEGELRVKDADAFRHALTNGIGHAKAFGFGLLSVAPV